MSTVCCAWPVHGTPGDGDEVVSYAFSHGLHPEHGQRLAATWAEALGGPTTYSDSYGDETSLVRIHDGNGRTSRSTVERSPACFDQALADVGLASDDSLHQWPFALSGGVGESVE